MKNWFGVVGLLLLLFCLSVPRSEASTGPIVFSTEANLGGNFFVETFTLANLQPTSNSGINLLKVRFDFPVNATVLSFPSGWSWVSSGTSTEAFSEFPGSPPTGTDVIPGAVLSGFRFFVNQSLGKIPITFTFSTPQANQVTTTGTSIISETFSAFSAKLETSGRTGFELNAIFSLGAGSDGFNLLTEPVVLVVGPFSGVIPPGSFTAHKDGRFEFEGVISGVNLEVRVTPHGNNRFSFTAEGKGVDLTALPSPVPVALTIGNHTGATAASVDE